MPDTTALEPTAACAGCGSLVVVRFKDKHREKCPARLANILREYRDVHGGVHGSIDDTIDSFDKDIDAIIKRLQDLEKSGDGQAGVTLTDDLDAPEFDERIDQPAPAARHPLTDVQPRINPLTGLPE